MGMPIVIPYGTNKGVYQVVQIGTDYYHILSSSSCAIKLKDIYISAINSAWRGGIAYGSNNFNICAWHS